MIKVAIIKKLPNGDYRLYSKKKDSHGKRRNLGTFNSYEAARKHEGQVEYFKYHADDQYTHDKETKALKSLSEVAQFLERAGFIDKANELYHCMDSFDCFDAEDATSLTDAQRNTENEGVIGNTEPTRGTFNSPEAETVASLANHFDKLGLFDEADVLDEILKEATNFGKTLNFSQNGNHKPQIQVSYFTNQDGDDVSKSKNFDDLDEAMEFFEGLGSEREMSAEDDEFEMTPAEIEEYNQQAKLVAGIKRLKQFYDEGSLDKIIKTHKLENWLAEFLGMNPRNYESMGFINGLMVAMDYIRPNEAGGNPEAYQGALYLWKNPNMEMDNIDALLNGNGRQEITALDNGSQFSGLSDSYFYQSYQNLDQRYKITP